MQELILVRNTPNIECPHLVNKKKFYLGQYSVVVLPLPGFARFY
jgi:hypothetical protein